MIPSKNGDSPRTGCINVGGKILEYNAYKLPDGQSMSDESQFIKPESGRSLRPEEVALVRSLLAGAYPPDHLRVLLETPTLVTCRRVE